MLHLPAATVLSILILWEVPFFPIMRPKLASQADADTESEDHAPYRIAISRVTLHSVS